MDSIPMPIDTLSQIDIPQQRGTDIISGFETLDGDSSFKACQEALINFPKGSLLHSKDRALIFHLVRSLDARRVLEIGTYHAGTTEILALAVKLNGGGKVITIDPGSSASIEDIIGTWPQPLKELTTFLAVDAMSFFTYHHSKDDKPYDLIFIDGNHDYEYVLFDLTMSAYNLRPDGIIVLDDAEQPGVFFAVKDFLEKHPSWRLAGNALDCYDHKRPFDTSAGYWGANGGSSLVLTRSDITDVGQRPTRFKFWLSEEENSVAGVELTVAPAQSSGTLSVQATLTSCFFPEKDGPARTPCSAMGRQSIEIEKSGGTFSMKFLEPLLVDTLNSSVVFLDLDFIWQPHDLNFRQDFLRFQGDPKVLSVSQDQ